MRKRWALGVALAVSVPAVAGYGSTALSSIAKEGGMLRLGTSSRIDSLNPYVALNQDAYSAFEYIYPLLVQYDRTNEKFAGDFAISWTVANDGKVWTFRTAANAKWSDGQSLTAGDAAWTINTDIRYRKTGAANAAGLIAHVVGASTPDPNTLVVRYDAPVSNALALLQQLPILPKHVWSKYTGNRGNNLKSFPNNAPVVSGGAFVLTKFKRGEVALFERNNSFYGRKPHIDGFSLQTYANDDAMGAAMKNGKLDAIEAVPPTVVSSLKQSGFNVSTSLGLDETDWIFNSNPKKPKHRELLNSRLREAFAHAINRRRIARVVFLGHAKPATTFIPPAAGNWHNPQIKGEAFNVGLANRMLDALGYKRGLDGIRVAGGHNMSYDVITPTDLPGVDRTFEIIQGDFRSIGVELKQKALDSRAAFDAIAAPGTKHLDFDLAMWDWVALIDPDFMLSVLTCAQYRGWNDSGYCDKTYDSLYSKQAITLNEDDRRAIVWQMQKQIFDQRPYIMLVYRDSIGALSRKWAGWDDSPQGPFNSLSKLSMTEVYQTG